jgi:hypothetical protein
MRIRLALLTYFDLNHRKDSEIFKKYYFYFLFLTRGVSMETRYIVGFDMCLNVGVHLNLLMPCTVKQKINLMMFFCFLDEEEDDAEKAR